MISAAEQQALIEGPSGNPGLPSDDFSDEAFAPSKKQNLKLGFLKVSTQKVGNVGLLAYQWDLIFGSKAGASRSKIQPFSADKQFELHCRKSGYENFDQLSICSWGGCSTC